MESEQMQRIIDELQRHCDDVKTGETQLTTPPGIKFATQSDGTVVGLYFNDDKQVIGYECGVYVVNRPEQYANSPKESLPLTPCTYEDLVVGEFYSAKEVPGIEDIRLVLDEATQAGIFGDEDARTYSGRPYAVWKVGK